MPLRYKSTGRFDPTISLKRAANIRYSSQYTKKIATFLFSKSKMKELYRTRFIVNNT